MQHCLFSDVYPICGIFTLFGIQQKFLYNGLQSKCFNILNFFIYWSTSNCDICCSAGVTVECQGLKVLSTLYNMPNCSLAHAVYQSIPEGSFPRAHHLTSVMLVTILFEALHPCLLHACVALHLWAGLILPNQNMRIIQRYTLWTSKFTF